MSAPLLAPAIASRDGGDIFARALHAALENAPYLARLARRLDVSTIDEAFHLNACDAAMAAADNIALAPPAFEEGMRALRAAKQQAHFGLAIGDLAGVLDLDSVTGHLTHFADASVKAALALAARALHERGDLTEAALTMPGMAIIAMGKMGAFELNYSSDIDFSVFYDPDVLPVAAGKEPRTIAQRIVAHIVRALEEVTADGYVFRTDLRLRPDPASTPPAVALAAAEQYYQSLGQNWERAAFIKARACAGDIARGEEFLETLKPYIWRRHLDYAAVADVMSIKRQIIAAKARKDLDDPVFDVKLGRGGIRDIELFAQTQQLILGGRNPHLRTPRTCEALAALGEAGVISAAARDDLEKAYIFYRGVEHRIQMLEDAHSHTAPRDLEERARLARLCGYGDVAAFDAALSAQRKCVAAFDQAFFGQFETLAAEEGSLIFTGVEDAPETLETLRRMGFAQPEVVSGAIRGWHHGRIRAMRAERARELLTALTPQLLRAIADSGEPDIAFARFATFFAGLSAGVTVLSLLQAHPSLLRHLALAFAAAPRMAQTLARRPALIDAMIDRRFHQPLSEDENSARRIRDAVNAAPHFETALNAARRAHREEAFRIGFQVLTGAAHAGEAGRAYADLADSCVQSLCAASLQETQRQFGRIDGACAIVALGKFGGRELSEGSDLDMMLVYDCAPDAQADGARSLAGGEYFARVTQRLISALSAQTEEGALYEVDMQLRPSGSKGPVAVRLSSFARYYDEEAWTWELLALTRLRVAAGDLGLGGALRAAAQSALRKRRDWNAQLADILDMRARMARERPAQSLWDLKLSPGGFVDIEFIAQALQLRAAQAGADVLRANTGEALQALGAVGALPANAAEELIEAWTLYSDLQHVMRIGLEGADVEAASGAFKRLMARAGGAPDFSALTGRLAAAQQRSRAWFTALLGSRSS